MVADTGYGRGMCRQVGLERSLLVLEPCYISLLSQTTIKLHNRSDVRVQFAWKAHRTARDDEQYRVREKDPGTGRLLPLPVYTGSRPKDRAYLNNSSQVHPIDTSSSVYTQRIHPIYLLSFHQRSKHRSP